MDMMTIPSGYAGELDLHHLQVFELLMRERSLTRAAGVLNVTQPALSKTLARLRRYFNDPLFVRVSLRMEPTSKALGLEAPVRAVLDSMRTLRSDNVPFDPKTSNRMFKFCVVDAGVIKLMPPLVSLLQEEAPHVRLSAVPFDALHLDSWLETGTIDFAMGSFRHLTKGIRRQPLWIERYVSLVRKGHPRLDAAPSLKAYAADKHVLVTTFGTGHAHQLAERAVEAAIPAENIVCRVPIFLAASIIAKHSEAVATLPHSIATVLAEDLDLTIVEPPIKLPKIEISQYWHQRFHREPGNQWIRAVFTRLFRTRAFRAAERS
jgi:DNA-binding transcriptional LysR family regulator